MPQHRHGAHGEALFQFGRAASEGRTNDMERLLREVEELKIDDSYWDIQSALWEALNSECVVAVRWLIQRGASVSSTQMYTAYEAFVPDRTSDRDSILRLLHKGRASVGSTYEPFHDPAVMIQAIRDTSDQSSSSLEVLKFLIRRRADVNAVDNETQQSPLIQALMNRREEMVRLLLKAGAKVDTRELVDQNGIQTALMVAAACSLNTSVRLLLERGASVADVDPNNWTALMYAEVPGNHYEVDEVVHLLVKAKSPINIQSNSGQTALMLAAQYEGNEIDEYTRYNTTGHTVQILLDHGASVDLVDSENWTALMYAASKGTASIITRLIAAGSPINAQSKSGETALMILLAQSKNYLSMMEFLLNRGASVNLANHQGWTPILIAAKHGHDEAVRLLLERGASLDAQTRDGDTIYSLAAIQGRERVAWILERHVGAIEASAQPTSLNSMDLTQDGDATTSDNDWLLLMEACANGDDVAALRLLQAGAPIDMQTVTGETALMRAVWKQNTSLVKVLVEKGATLDLKDKQDSTALLKAVASGNTEITECLLQGGASVDAQGKRGETVLMLAAFNGNEPMVQVLIRHGANVNLKAGPINLDWKPQRPGWTAIMFAAYNGFENVVDCLIQVGAAINPSNEFFWDCDHIPLTCAANGGHVEVVRMLLDHGANVDATTSVSDTALVWAIRKGHTQVAQILMEFNAQLDFGGTGEARPVNIEPSMYTPLMCAAENGKEDIVRLLIHHGASVDFIERSRTPLVFAAEGGHTECVRVLLEHGASITDWGKCALQNATSNGHHECVRLLIDAGTNVKDVNGPDDFNVLMNAAEKGHEKCVRLLLDGGALIDQQRFDGCTALIYAAKKGFSECVRLLVEYGASIDLKEKRNGFSALVFAADRGHEECVRIILNTGPIIDVPLIDGQTVLMRAAMHGQFAIVDLLISLKASVDLVDDEHHSALMWAAKSGYTLIVDRLIQAKASIDLIAADGSSALSLATASKDIVQMLVENGASVETVDRNGETPLVIATENGRDDVVRFLVEAGASKDQKQSTAMKIAILKGNATIVGILREGGVALDVSLFTLAVDFGEFTVIRELLRDNVCLMTTCANMQYALPRVNLEPAETQPTPRVYDLDYSMATARQCLKMPDVAIIFNKLHARLMDLGIQLTMLPKILQRHPLKCFKQIIKSTQSCLDKYSDMPTIGHLVNSRQIVDTCRSIHDDIDEFMTIHGFSSEADDHADSKAIFEEDARKYLSVALNSMETNHQMLFDELQELETSNEVLALLRFEYENRASFHTREEMKLIQMFLDQASKLSSSGSLTVPKWFISPQYVDVDVKDSIAKGGYGSVHRGCWLGSEIIVKRPLLKDPDSRDMFLREVDIWHRLKHLNIVELYGACHLEKPMLICEYAVNGTLSDFLYRENGRAKVWEKLYEAAAGLQYMHEVHKVVHGDLKCDNILVGGPAGSRTQTLQGQQQSRSGSYSENGPAKLTDFGLSYKGVDPNTDEIAAIQWKAPEVIQCRTRGSFASDVYSLGMCILEAVKGEFPWGNFEEITVKNKLLRFKQQPSRPEEVNDVQWKLITRMIAWDPLDRPRIGEVVDILKKFC